MKCTIDRREEDFFVVQTEDAQSYDLPAALLAPLDAREGDILEIRVCREETERTREASSSLLHSLFARTAAEDAEDAKTDL